MAFEKISDYSQKLYDEIHLLEQSIQRENDPVIRSGMNIASRTYWSALVLYYETVLQHAKFKGQRDHCRHLMEKINPAWCQGYFKTSKKKKS